MKSPVMISIPPPASDLTDAPTSAAKIRNQHQAGKAAPAGWIQQRYLDLSRLYAATRARRVGGGIAEAQRRHAETFEREVIEPLYHARSDLMAGYPSFALAPMVSTALFIETHAMIMANYPSDQALSRLGQYDTWLRAANGETEPSALPGAIRVAERRRAELLAGERTWGAYVCHTEKQQRLAEGSSPREGIILVQGFIGSPSPPRLRPNIRWVVAEDGVAIERRPFADAALERAIAEMMALKLFTAADRPLQAIPKPHTPEPVRTVMSWPRGEGLQNVTGQRDINWLNALRPCTPEDLALREKRAALAVEIVVRPDAETADCAIQAAKGMLAGGH